MAKLCYNYVKGAASGFISREFNVNPNFVKRLVVDALNTFFYNDKEIQGLDEKALNNATIACAACSFATKTSHELAVLHFISVLLMDEKIKHEYVSQLTNMSTEETMVSAMLSTIICDLRS